MTVSEADTDTVSDLIAKADIVTPMTIRAAVRTGLFDVASTGAEVTEIADRLGGDVRAVATIVTHLVHEGLLARDGDTVTTTAMGRLLVDGDNELGLRELYDPTTLVGRNENSLIDLHHTLLTGRPAAEATSGRTLWEEIDSDGRVPADFEWEEPGFAAELVLGNPLWSEVGSVIDIGGNTGSLMLALLDDHPHLRGAVLDFSAFTEVAEKRAHARGVGDRLTGSPGSFFDPLPDGYDVYLLSAVLADWDDDDALHILRRAAEACADGARLMVAEVHLVPTGSLAAVSSTAVRLEASVTRPDRTPDEILALLKCAGLMVDEAHTQQPDRSLFLARAEK